MDVSAPVLLHEIIGFAIPGKVDDVSLLLHVMPEMEAAGCMPESFTADDKEDLHEKFRILFFTYDAITGSFISRLRKSPADITGYDY